MTNGHFTYTVQVWGAQMQEMFFENDQKFYEMWRQGTSHSRFPLSASVNVFLFYEGRGWSGVKTSGVVPSASRHGQPTVRKQEMMKGRVGKENERFQVGLEREREQNESKKT